MQGESLVPDTQLGELGHIHICPMENFETLDYLKMAFPPF